MDLGAFPRIILEGFGKDFSIYSKTNNRREPFSKPDSRKTWLFNILISSKNVADRNTARDTVKILNRMEVLSQEFYKISQIFWFQFEEKTFPAGSQTNVDSDYC